MLNVRSGSNAEVERRVCKCLLLLRNRTTLTDAPPLHIYKTALVWLVRAEDKDSPVRAVRHMRRGPSMRNLA